MKKFITIEDESHNLYLENTEDPTDTVMASNGQFRLGDIVDEESIEIKIVNVAETEPVGTYSTRMAFRKVCPTCKGDGLIDEGHFEGDEIVERTITCPDCNGSGVTW